MMASTQRLKHTSRTLLLLLFLDAVIAKNNLTTKDDDLVKKQNSPVGVYIYNNGDMFTLDEFFNSAKENIDSDDMLPPMVSSCRNYARQVEEQNIAGLDIVKAASGLSTQLRDISNYELGVTEMQKIYDGLPFKNFKVNYKEQAEMMASKIKKKIGNYLEALDKNKRLIEELYIHHLWSLPVQSVISCYNIKSKHLKFDKHYGTNVNMSRSCETILPEEASPNLGFSPGRNLTKIFILNRKAHLNMKWQYFMTSKGVHSEYPAYHLKSKVSNEYSLFRHNNIFTSTIYPGSKLVVVLLDVSKSMSNEQFNLAKNISIGIIDSLSEGDYFTVLTVANYVHHPCFGHLKCNSNGFFPVDRILKMQVKKCILNLDKMLFGLHPNHSLGFKESFDMISKWFKNQNSSYVNVQPVIMYVSRGLIKTLTDGLDVMKIIADSNKKLDGKVVINACALVNKVKSNYNEKQFLKIIAEQRLNSSGSPDYIRKGKVVEYGKDSNFRATINKLWSSLKPTSSSDASYSLPNWDFVGNGVVISIGKPCFHMRNVIGMVGLDLHLNDFAEDIMYMSSVSATKSHSFIVHKNGQVVIHSSLGQNTDLHASSVLTIDVSHLYKDVVNFQGVRRRLLKDYIGQRKLRLKKQVVSNDTFNNEMNVFTHAMFTWRRIDDTPYIVCLVVYDNTKLKRQKRVLNLKKSSCNDYVSYHRLDVNLPRKLRKSLCRNYNQIVSLETSVIYLAPSAFVQPYKFLNQPDTKEKLDSYFGYLCDTTNLIPNPGMKPNVRSETAAVIRIGEYWRERVTVSRLNDYIVRRYVGLPSGVVHTFPGTVINKNYDVTSQQWYLEALTHTGKVVVSSPSTGAEGQMVTLSHTIYEGKRASMHSTSDSVIAVMGMDISVGFIHQLLIMSIPLCQEETIRCFIFDSKGYFVTHPDLLKSGHIDHITHGEQLVANDILCHEGFVEKRACYDYNSQTVQRSYRFNTKWTGVLKNLVHGEHCARYEITSIPNTNLFLGVINQTCNVQIAFCSCSTMDRLCLNCKRMDETECACPCECPLSSAMCSNDVNSFNLKTCPKVSRDTMVAEANLNILNELDSCINIDCASRKTHRDCFGVIGCVWCTKNFDDSKLEKPFCTEQLKCFHGRLVNQAAYRGESFVPSATSDSTSSTTAVAGGIMTFFFLLVIFVYYARKLHNRNDTVLQGNISSCTHHQSVDTFDNEPYEYIDDGSQAINPHGMLLAEYQNASPYRVNSTYRRPNPCDSSDHGYSTMTPQDDSVHNGLNNSEVIGLSLLKRNSGTTHSLTSFESEISSEQSTRLLTPPTDTAIATSDRTILPDKLDAKDGSTRFLARAQIHMVEC